jgi:Zn-dependent peptidase ImmA (M78 family)/transcriptional regulator with XRE-family HTH domain
MASFIRQRNKTARPGLNGNATVRFHQMLTASDIGARLRALRDDAHLDEDTAARAAGLSIEDVRAAEEGGPVRARVLVWLAAAYGLTETDLVDTEPPVATAVSTLLRGAAEDKTKLALSLGRLALVCREQTALENILGITARAAVTRFPPAGPPTAPPYAQAELLANQVRQTLNLGSAPIRSMSQLLGELGVRLIWTDKLDEHIRGLSLDDGRVGPSVVINVGRHRTHPWWGLRSTIAHELCHVLFDRVPTAPFGTVSRRKSNLSIEQRADAFAYYFLAPREGVARFLRESLGRVPQDLDRNDIQAFANHFAIGIEAATWHLRNLGWLSEVQRSELVRMNYPIEPELDTESPWANTALKPFIDKGVELERLGLTHLAVTAFTRGQITEGRLREALGLSPFAELPSQLVA